MNIQHQHDSESNNAFFVEQEGAMVAHMTYEISKRGNIVIQHTAVNAVLKGQGIGQRLLVEI